MIFWIDLCRFWIFRQRWRHKMTFAPGVSPNFRLAHWTIEDDAHVRFGAGCTTERHPGNQIRVESGGTLTLAESVWLSTDQNPNRIRVFPGASLEIGKDSFVNGASFHVKRSIRVGDHCLIGFGVRIFDSDLHAIDRDTPERIRPVKIGDRVWIGADTLIMSGVTIGDDVVVGAGSIVTRDIPANTLAIGRPAVAVRSIGSRRGCA